jgi:hypothetical protein
VLEGGIGCRSGHLTQAMPLLILYSMYNEKSI